MKNKKLNEIQNKGKKLKIAMINVFIWIWSKISIFGERYKRKI